MKPSGFWYEPMFPQYRKVLNSEEAVLDGTETEDTEIVCYDYSPEYLSALNAGIQEMKGGSSAKPN